MLKGKYGADKLGYLMLCASILFTVVAALLSPQNIIMRVILLVISAVILAYAVFRIFSKNIGKRRRELRVLEMAQMRILTMLGGQKSPLEHSNNNGNVQQNNDERNALNQTNTSDAAQVKVDEFKHFKCPRCKKNLKVPTGKGYVKVCCPTCGNKFTKRT